MTDQERKIYIEVLNLFGEDSQIGMMQEEAAKVIQVINKWKRGIRNKEDVCDELADLEIMLDQMNIIFPKKTIKECKELKLIRLQDRMDFFRRQNYKP